MTLYRPATAAFVWTAEEGTKLFSEDSRNSDRIFSEGGVCSILRPVRRYVQMYVN
jgi:hypothetical protein